MANARRDIRNLSELAAYGAQSGPEGRYQFVYELAGESSTAHKTTLTATQLALRAEAAAASLAQHGVERSDRLLLVVPSLGMDTALAYLLGAIELGCVVAPEGERLAQLLAAAAVSGSAMLGAAARSCSPVLPDLASQKNRSSRLCDRDSMML